MAGIYVHIPFCRRKCGYCDFYKSTQIDLKEQLLDALVLELNHQKDYLQGDQIETIYFGGGTPSVLRETDIQKILLEIFHLFNVSTKAEITFEANPDDLTPEYLGKLSFTTINRLSIGVQSFFDDDLQQTGRRHNSKQAFDCVNDAYSSGFKNLSIDLIYGLPKLTREKWLQNLETAFSLPVAHISAYHLTYHEGTPFYDLKTKGVLKEIGEDDSLNQFEMLIEEAEKAGFIHYEISNFAKEGAFSKHNSAYWFGEKYLGIGPSAHSYDGESRQWNKADINQYIEKITLNKPFFEKEILNTNSKYNDYILTSLRTIWGISESFIIKKFGVEYFDYLKKTIQPYIHSGHVVLKEGIYTFTKAGLFISDDILAALMVVGPI